MEVIVAYQMEIDGRELTDEEVTNAVLAQLMQLNMIVSLSADGTDEWAILVNSVEVKEIIR